MFVGYGLDELEILEYVILKAKGLRSGPHFILQSFFSHELDLANSLADYYKNECGVLLIPFQRDLRDHEQLIDVIESFARDLKVGPMLNQERRVRMDEFFNG